MSALPPIVLTADDVDYLVDECAGAAHGAIVSGLSAHRHLTNRHEQVNRARYRAGQPRIDFAAFLSIFTNELAPAARVKANSMGLDPKQLPDGTSLGQTDKAMLWDVLALDAIEAALWRRSEDAAAHAAETVARAQALVDRHHKRFPDGETLPGIPGEPRRPESLPWPADPDSWMLRYAAGHFGQNGEPISRTDGVAVCKATLGCGDRAAGVAYTALPEPLRAKQGRPQKKASPAKVSPAPKPKLS